MSEVQFSHSRNAKFSDRFTLEVDSRGGVTTALEIPPHWLLRNLRVGESFDKKVGIAVCSTEDNYNKKIGRELSSSRLKYTKLTCSEVQDEDGGNRKIALSDNNGNVFLLKLLATGKVFFLTMVRENQ